MATHRPFIIYSYPTVMFKYRNLREHKNNTTKANNRHLSLNRDQLQQPQSIKDAPKNSKDTQQESDSKALSEPLKELTGITLKRLFMVFSRMHWVLKLRHKTLFLALEIYIKYVQSLSNPEELGMPNDCLIVVSAYLAMKYEEIYPPSLQLLFAIVKNNISAKEYIRYEAEVVIKLDGNLNIPTASRRLQEIFKNSSSEVYNHAYFLLELAYFDPKIIQEYSINVICLSIYLVMLPLKDQMEITGFGDVDKSEIENCARKIVYAKHKSRQSDSLVYRKYCSSRYMEVAERPFPVISKIE